MMELPQRHRPSVDAHINIVPYIDVMLVLLVIFMMTTPIIEQGIEVDLPTADAKWLTLLNSNLPLLLLIKKASILLTH